jgi:Co/Zn/Cd efflux system component
MATITDMDIPRSWPFASPRPSATSTPQGLRPAFAIGAALNLGFVLAEAGAGLMTHSLALLADAGHNLSDVLGLFMAWGAATLAKRAPAAATPMACARARSWPR